MPRGDPPLGVPLSTPLTGFAKRGVAAQAAVDKLTAPKKSSKKGAHYPMRELAEMSRESARVWDRWAAVPNRRAEMAYGAHTLADLFRSSAYVLDTMADKERQEDEPPPKAALTKLQK